MELVKVRRIGNSNVISLPRELEELGYRPGTQVVVRRLPGGGLMVLPVDQVDAMLDRLTERIVAERRPVLDRLAEYDRAQGEA